MTVEKPWGKFLDIAREKEYVLKIITVNPNEELSLQYHNNRSEFWVVLSGKGKLKLQQFNYHNEESYYITLNLSEGSTYHIKKGQHHQLINSSNEELKVLELQYGECSEEDIIRINDKYGR